MEMIYGILQDLERRLKYQFYATKVCGLHVYHTWGQDVTFHASHTSKLSVLLVYVHLLLAFFYFYFKNIYILKVPTLAKWLLFILFSKSDMMID